MKRFTGLFALIAILVFTGQGCFGGGGSSGEELVPVSLEIWGVFDDEDDYNGLIRAYQALHPNVSIDFTEFRSEEYDQELIEAFAEDRAPDIFMVHNTQIGQFESLMEPMPSSVTVTFQELRSGIRKELVTFAKEVKTPSMRDISQSFAAQVPEDIVRFIRPNDAAAAEQRVMGLPLSLDSMALFYNRDLFDAAGVAAPPLTWTEFQEDVVTLTEFNNQGEVRNSAAAIGESDNVERATDILSLLMMQNGTEMVDERGRVSFHLTPEIFREERLVPGIDATVFYTDFANPTKQVYTWNDAFPDSFDAFSNGETAMFFGYSYHIPLLRTVAPKLNFDLAPMPQISGGQQVNYANYWIHSVSKDSTNIDWAWDFLIFASDEDNVGTYLDSTRRPTALRNLINTQIDDNDLAVFAEQTLTARSWYTGSDADAMEAAFRELIDAFLAGPEDMSATLSNIAKRVEQTY